MIKTIQGNAVYPEGNGMKIIVHCCNDRGAWGAGFVLALSARWKEPEQDYRSLDQEGLKLGNVQFVSVEDDIIVANLIGQHNTHWENGVAPIRYNAIENGLKTIKQMAKSMNASIHCPQFGAGLAGGSWLKIEEIITDVMDEDVDVTVYEFVNTNDPNYVKSRK